LTAWIELLVNGAPVAVEVEPMRRLSSVLRDELGLTGTKVGCEAGDCGACTVRIDGEQACACLVPVAQAAGTDIRTVEGLAPASAARASAARASAAPISGPDRSLEFEDLAELQRAFLAAGAAQCGFCTPGMLMAADDHLDHGVGDPLDALGGVLCRCTGYRKIVDAVDLAVGGAAPASEPEPPIGAAVGSRVVRVDGVDKVTGAERFGADDRPVDALAVRAIRSPHHRARFTIADLEAWRASQPGIELVLTAADMPGQNRYGIYTSGKDQPVLAEGLVRHRGEVVLALVGSEAAVQVVDEADLPIDWQPLPPLLADPGGHHALDAALAPGAPRLHDHAHGNVLIEGRVARGDAVAALAGAAVVETVEIETTFLEHAAIEPEAGIARRIGDRLELFVSTQTPYMDRDEVALVMGLAPEQVRIVPSACGGGFGGKLDLSVQPLIALAAWLTGRPCRAAWTRPESMAASPKRHPARISATFGADVAGRLVAARVHGDFDTGAYASWGPTVANRVPVHASGPYRVPAVLATTRAVYSDGPPAGAFRGFGVPQAAIAHEAAMDALAARLGRDPLEFRLANALRAGDVTATGQTLAASVGLAACLEALRPRWRRLRADATAFNEVAVRVGSGSAGDRSPLRRGVGVGAMWYGIGNTSLPNPSTIEIAREPDGSYTLLCGAVDIGQGASTVLRQIAADTLGVPPSAIRLVSGDTDLTTDAGKSSASRQTFVSGNATRLAALDLLERCHGPVTGGDTTRERIVGRGTFDPRTTPLDGDGQGVPYATYAFGAQVALVEVDIELGTTRVLSIVAAHDVGRAVNPTLLEGQVEGGIAQGLGFALMEAFVPGRTENLHDYLIPTIGDIPDIETILVEDPEPAGPFGAKGVGEPALIPTAPAILGAIEHATGIRITTLPATPDRIRAAITGRSIRRAAGRATSQAAGQASGRVS
jgi:CO/xanthine dehydrogenase Mo-binding subunit/aerobic-type carbon monoxide dehydrogenase small subunit (CoxS/CutS family)